MNDDPELVKALVLANEDRALLRAALEEATLEKDRVKREQQETERWLRHLERSRSWKLTRPIRDAGAAFRSLSRRLSARRTRRV